MSSSPTRSPTADYIFWATTILACLSQSGLFAITIVLVKTNAPLDGSIYGVAMAACASDILALAASTATSFLYLRRTGRKIRLVLRMLFITLAVVAAIITVYMLASFWTIARQAQTEREALKLTQQLIEAGFAVWILSVATEIILYATVLWPQQQKDSPTQSQSMASNATSSPVSMKRSISVRLGPLTPPKAPAFSRSTSEPSSPSPSAMSFSPPSSIRRSVSNVVRPITSKTRLLHRPSFNSRDGSESGRGSVTTIQDDGFASWDTSAVENANDIFTHDRPTTRRLETIPGSRPVSPANPLNGPFAEDDAAVATSSVDDTTRPPSSEDKPVKTTTRPPSRQDSNAEQSHIHPLFRVESPVPPPIKSPGTVITASPFAGQIINPDQTMPPRRLHSAHSHRADSPTGMSSPTKFRPLHSSASPRVYQTSPVPWLSRELEQPAVADGSNAEVVDVMKDAF